MSDQQTEQVTQDDDPIWIAMPKYWVGVPIYEWKRRTWWGKLTYPYWLFASVISWMIFIPLVLIGAGVKAMHERENQSTGLLPPKYKDE